MFDAKFALTESIRFYFDLQEGKKKIFEGLLPGMRAKDVLDFGCGCGFYTAWFSSVARSVDGVDISPASLTFAEEINPGPRYFETVPDLTYDVIICADSLEFNDNPLEVFDSLWDRLRRGGKLYISAPDFQPRQMSFITRAVWALYSRITRTSQRTAIEVVRKIEKDAGYHARYNRDFNEKLVLHLKQLNIDWRRISYPMTGWRKNHFLYILNK